MACVHRCPLNDGPAALSAGRSLVFSDELLRWGPEQPTVLRFRAMESSSASTISPWEE